MWLLRHLIWSQAATGRTQTLQLYLPQHPPSATQNRCPRRELGERLMPCTFHYLCVDPSVSSHCAVQVGTTTGVPPQYLRLNYQPINGCTMSASTSSNLSGTQTHLPCPEPPILQGIHLGLRESTDPILECLIPVLPLNERYASSLNCSLHLDS